MAVTVGNVTHAGTATNTGGTVSMNHTSNSNTLWVDVNTADGGGGVVATSVTAGGTAMTKVWGLNNTAQFASSGWILTGVATSGTITIVVSWGVTAQNAGCSVGARSLIGVDQTTPNGTAVTASSTANANPAVTANSVSGDLCIAGCADFATGITSGGSQTNDFSDVNLATFISCAGDERAAIGTTTAFTWTGTGTTNAGWAAGAVNIKPAASGSTLTAAFGSYSLAGQTATLSSANPNDLFILANAGNYALIGAFSNSDVETPLAFGIYNYNGQIVVLTGPPPPSTPGGGSMMMLFGKRKR